MVKGSKENDELCGGGTSLVITPFEAHHDRMLWMDTVTYLATKDDPAGPTIKYAEDGIEPMTPITDEEGRVTKGGAIGYVAAYGVLVAFPICFFLFV